jgi:hypothetical protein
LATTNLINEIVELVRKDETVIADHINVSSLKQGAVLFERLVGEYLRNSSKNLPSLELLLRLLPDTELRKIRYGLQTFPGIMECRYSSMCSP